MTNLYTIVAKNQPSGLELTEAEVSSVIYHDIFDYPLSFSELIKWKVGGLAISHQPLEISKKGGYFFVDGRSGLIYKRVLRKRISDKKLEIAKDAAGVLSLIPLIKFVGITGSLAMENSAEESDIDLMVITKKGSLWTSRIFAYLLFVLSGISFRRAGKKDEKNRLCLNMWLDEGDLSWPKRDRNIYTAHEIAQIKPLVNKNKTYEKLVSKNKWILKYWPNAVGNKYIGDGISYIGRGKVQYTTYNILHTWVEKLAFWFQHRYMKPKITREVVTPTRAIFHPQDWGKVVLDRIKSFSDAS